MEYRLIDNIREFQDISERWDEALIQSGEDNPFLLSEFITTWWKFHLKNKTLRIYVLLNQGQVVGGIPLCIQRKYFRKILTHIGGIHANVTAFFSIIEKLNFIEHLMSYLEKNGEWDIFVLDRVLSDNPLVKFINKRKSLDSNGLAYYVFDNGYDGVIDLEPGYKKIIENISSRLKRYINKGKREAEKMGELRLERLNGELNIQNLFKDFRELSIKSFRERKDRSAFEKESRSHFYEDLLLKFDKSQKLDAHRLTVGPDTLGISFGYRFGKGFKWILTTFNPDFSRLRPGHLLIDALVKEAINRGDPYFDMYYGGEVFYKQQWCQKMIPLKRIEICRNGVFNKSLIVSRHKLRSNEKLMNIARGVRRTIQMILH